MDSYDYYHAIIKIFIEGKTSWWKKYLTNMLRVSKSTYIQIRCNLAGITRPHDKFLILWKIHLKIRSEFSRNERSIIYGTHYTETHRDREWLSDNTGEFQINNGLLILATQQSCCSFVIFLIQKNGPSGIKHFSLIPNT